MKTINWKNTDLINQEYQFCNLNEMPDEILEKIISDNREYLIWKDGSEIKREELSDFMLIKRDGVYSLTMKDEDFYINDIFFEEEKLTYDIHFNDSENSNSKGFNKSEEECMDYIETYNKTNHSYFGDYKGGIVSIVCNQTGETVFETEVL